MAVEIIGFEVALSNHVTRVAAEKSLLPIEVEILTNELQAIYDAQLVDVESKDPTLDPRAARLNIGRRSDRVFIRQNRALAQTYSALLTRADELIAARP